MEKISSPKTPKSFRREEKTKIEEKVVITASLFDLASYSISARANFGAKSIFHTAQLLY
jgi:hypothetical protein